jgi:phosphatidylinositol alpha-1,6-mannosyltransferase
MRTLLVTNDYPPRPGGIQQYLGNLVDSLSGEVLVLAPADGAAVDTRRGEQVVRRHRRRFVSPTGSARRWIEGQAREFRPDVILFGAPYPLASLGPRLRTDLAVPVAVLCHGAEVTMPSVLPAARQLLRRALRGADIRFAVSRFTAARVERLTGKPVTYIGSGVDPSAFHPAAPAAQGGVELPVVGCVSRFVPRKGQHRLISAAARLRDRGIPVRLLFVGKGRKLGALQRLASRHSVEARFEVGVPFSQLPGLYRKMDAFCIMPCRSRWGGLEIEGLGIVYLEAAASGLPVLAGDSGGAPETVRPGKTGFVVHSVGDIVEGLEMLLGDRARAAEMGAAGRDFVTAEFTWKRVAERYETALADIV